MDEVLIDTLRNQIKEGNKADGDWKPQAYQAVVDALRNKLQLVVTSDHVKNRIKSWKKHYAVVTDIRTMTKFKWDEERKMVVIGGDDLEQWLSYVKEHPNAGYYKNKAVEHWDDICTLCGPDRALGDGVEAHEDAAAAMDEEFGSEDASSSKEATSSKFKKRKKDCLAEAVIEYVEYMKSKSEKKGDYAVEVYDVVSKVPGILRHQVMNATRRFINSSTGEFELLKRLPDDQKLDWVLELINN